MGFFKGLGIVLLFMMVADFAVADRNRICAAPGDAEKKLKSLHLRDRDNSITISDAFKEKIGQFLLKGEHEGWCHDKYPAGQNVRLTGPMIAGNAHGTHARVKIFYSKGVVRWLDNGRKGRIPDGAMIVKEMYPYPAKSQDTLFKPDGWAVMIRDRKASVDGWLWVLLYVPGNTPYPLPFVFGQYGNSFCLSCHASTDNTESTFSFVGNLEDKDLATYVTSGSLVQPDSLGNMAPPNTDPMMVIAMDIMKKAQEKCETRKESQEDLEACYQASNLTLGLVLYIPTTKPREDRNETLLELIQTKLDLNELEPPDIDKVLAFPGRYEFDHIVAKPGEDNLYLTSFECSGCHDASDLLNKIDPNMTAKLDQPMEFLLGPADKLNLSPYGEWTSSLMGVSGRDPVFRSQLEYELSNFSDPQEKEKVSKICLGCHSVMGKRDNEQLAGNPDNVYARLDPAKSEHTDEEKELARFGALARDGISCVVCHRIADEGLGTTFSGEFVTGPADSIYGPYESVKTLPMENAIGLTPTHGKHISDSGMCGTCHALKVPVYAGEEELEGRHVWEQTTYMEWANSDYANADSQEGQTCQECHMPVTNPMTGLPMVTKIANIEDETFPYVPARADTDSLSLTERGSKASGETYRRHVLTGANVFVMSMFEQFPKQLGANTHLPGRSTSIVRAKLFATEETLRQARQRTATVSIKGVHKTKKSLNVHVKVENLTGHKLPSGVGFRRAFVEFSVLDTDGAVIWCSGCTDSSGVIIDGSGAHLSSEFADRYSNSQPDYSVITREDQVQIYEHRNEDSTGLLTTSFLHLYKSVKDNRLLPRGWRKDGPWSEETAEHGVVTPSTPGMDNLTYKIPLTSIPGASSVKVAIQSQSIPPYYLLDRFSLLKKADSVNDFPETQRLLALTLHLNLEGRADEWKLTFACTKRSIHQNGTAADCLPPVTFRVPIGANIATSPGQ